MRFSILAIVGLVTLTACQPPVQVSKNIDGSTTTTLKGDNFEMKTNEQTGESTMKTGDGSTINSRTQSDGSYTAEATNAKGEKTSISTSNDFDYAAFGLKQYPGATIKEGQQAAFSADTPEARISNLTVFTTDSKEQVIAHFEPHITGNKSKSSNNEFSMIGGKTQTGAEVSIICSMVDGKTQIAITANLKKK
jgi:hypothetical protein